MSTSSIYVIGHDQAFKIGFSKHPEARLKQLQTAQQHQLRLLWSMPRGDAAKLEKHLHRRFSKHKIKGEWFDCSQLPLKLIIAECYTYAESDW